MPSRSAERTDAGVWRAAGPEAELWLDYDPAVRELPGLALGRRTLAGPAAEEVTELHRAGVRCLRLTEPVRLCADAPAASARALMLLREATGQGLAVLWHAVCTDGCAEQRRFHHLYPPEELTGAAAEVGADWRASYFPSKCVYRRGPGFVEVRDRRFGTLELFTIDEPGHLAQLDALADGVEVGLLPEAVHRDFAEAGLIAEQAGRAWFLPMRVRRWPFPSLTV
ncbi:DUF5825 family protein [Kitasatospora purpeofusca]|uniref:DUF5825 family protein n=1 Tax=Kitasatospora purpeofusca TaxID=67352 RepID=UPI0038706D4D|nr:DUF5825 family protein [Kitasatospora purpeofusca]